MNTTVEPSIEWSAQLNLYTMDVVIDGENEELVFSTLCAAREARTEYLAGL